MMKLMNLISPQNAYIGNGAIAAAIPMIKMTYNAVNVGIITDSFLESSGLVEKAAKPFKDAGMNVFIWSKVRPNPSLQGVKEAKDFLLDNKCDVVIGFGGGSSMDTAKAASGLISNGGDPIDYVDKKPMAKEAALPIITIPTTAGTGAETSGGGIFVNDETGIKGAIFGMGTLTPKFTLFEPELLCGLPPHLTASTGMDAMVHAIESFVMKRANPLGDMYAAEAIKTIAQNIRIACTDGSNLEARYNMAYGAWVAGLAMCSAGTAAVHAFAYPLESKFHVPHGAANACMLPAVTRYNIPGNIPKYKQLAVLLGENIDGLSDRDAAYKAADALDALNKDIRIPTLKDLGVQESDFEELTKIMLTYERLTSVNPMPVDMKSGIEVYRAAF